MEWYNVISIIVGALGGTAGLIGMYKAKSEKTTIDVGNMQTMLDEAKKMYDTMSDEKKESDAKLDALDKRVEGMEKRILVLTRAIYQGYRCAFPQKAEECPVLLEYEKTHCQECINQVDNKY